MCIKDSPWRLRLRGDKSLLLMTVPALLLPVLFNSLPMAGIIVAFECWCGAEQTLLTGRAAGHREPVAA